MLNTRFAPFAFLACAGVASGQSVEHSHPDHAAHTAAVANAQRQADVARRGSDVMPFRLPATRHIFSKTVAGGVQQVVARQPADAEQIRLIRQHLLEIRDQFTSGDFSAPMHIHGEGMPGLADLKAAKAGQIAVDYKELEDGAELSYTTSDSGLVAALHEWFDAQLADHGQDATAGHVHRDGMKKQ